MTEAKRVYRIKFREWLWSQNGPLESFDGFLNDVSVTVVVISNYQENAVKVLREKWHEDQGRSIEISHIEYLGDLLETH